MAYFSRHLQDIRDIDVLITLKPADGVQRKLIKTSFDERWHLYAPDSQEIWDYQRISHQRAAALRRSMELGGRL